ncbi:MAG: hypothetical protein AAF903_15325 [Pseudomonadota bacterium]
MSDEGLAISYIEDFPPELIEMIESEIGSTGQSIALHRRENTPYASMEWAIPTALIIYITKPYFEAFLGEAGKDHYNALKKGVMRAFRHLFGEKPELRVECRSLLFSIQARTWNDKTIKCIFPEGVSALQYQVMIEQLHELLVEDYSKKANSGLSAMLDSVEPFGGQSYIEFSSDKIVGSQSTSKRKSWRKLPEINSGLVIYEA